MFPDLESINPCLNCYWSEWNNCKINGTIRTDGKTCINYLNDKNHSKWIHKKLRSDPEWCRNHWSQLDDVDRRKYIEYYGC